MQRILIRRKTQAYFIALWYIGITSDFGSEKPCSIHGGATIRLDNLCANTVSCQVPFRRCVLGDPLIGPGERSDTPSIRVQISASQQQCQGRCSSLLSRTSRVSDADTSTPIMSN